MLSSALTIIVPQIALSDAVRFVAYFFLGVYLPGGGVARLCGLRLPNRCERWALTAVLGFLWSGWLYFALGVFGQQHWHLALVWLPIVGLLRPMRGRWRRGRWWRGVTTAELVGLLLAGLFVGGYLARTATEVRYDEHGLRLYGAWYSDKLVNMSPCASLIHEVPPRSLRLAGQSIPHHYFPHLFVACLAREAGIDYVRGFWFYAAGAGIAVTGLAILSFCRRQLHSYRLGCLALLLVGLARFDAETKPLDLSIAMLFLLLAAVDRWRASGRRRWAVLATILVGTMPLYEAFHAATVCGGLIVWWLAGIAWRGVRWPQIVRRTALVGSACVLAYLVAQVMFLGPKVVSATEFLIENSYRSSYKDEWRKAARETGPYQPIARTLLSWKWGKPRDDNALQPLPDRPGVGQRMVGELVFEAGLPLYVFLRFVNLAAFGVAALWVVYRRKPQRWRSSLGIVAAVATVGFVTPCFLNWGHYGDGKWWGTPNLYRLPACAYLLLVPLGVGVMVAVVRAWRRPMGWLAIAIVAWQGWVLLVPALTPSTSFHHVSFDRLEALTFLRTGVPYGEVVIHPWIDDLIRDAREPDKVAWVYKRHFTLGSNLAGRQMYYEGREDHLFIGGFILPEEAYRRSRLRRQFYRSPDAPTVAEVIDRGQVAWVVADNESPAPPAIAATWPIAFRNATTRIYRRRIATVPMPGRPPGQSSPRP